MSTPFNQERKMTLRRCLAPLFMAMLCVVLSAAAWADGPGLRILSSRMDKPSLSHGRALLSAVSPAATDAVASHAYAIMGIAPSGNAAMSTAYGINDHGEVVGRIYNIDADTDEAIDQQAFKWSALSGVELLPTLSGQSLAWAINDGGMASGFSENSAGNQRAVRWDGAADNPIDLGSLTSDALGQSGDTSRAYELNNQGTVVGNADIPIDASYGFTPFHGFIHRDATGIQDMGTLTTDWPQYENGYSITYDINEDNVAVGLAGDSSFAFQPFVWDAADGMVALPTNPDYSGGEWYAVALNNAGLIAGHVITSTNRSLPHYWPDRNSVPVEIPMPAGFPYGEIYAVNDSGVMVGIMWSDDSDAAVEHAFAYDTTNGVRDLNDLIDSSDGWVLTFARDINNSNQIVGTGEIGGVKQAFVLTPRMALSTQVAGQGSITRNPDAPAYAAGTVVQLDATPDSGWTFSHWTGPVADANSAQTSVTMDADTTVTAVFILPEVNYRLTVATEGQGAVTPSPDAVNYPAGTQVQLSATPDPGWTFSHWTGPVVDADSAQTSVTMDADITVTAVFLAAEENDQDEDGVPDSQEQGPEGNDPTYDGNADGTPDAAQPYVTSTFCSDGTRYVTLEVDPGLGLTHVSAIDPTAMGDLPSGAAFDWGLFRFTITGVPAGGRVAVRLHLPADARPDTFYKFGPTIDNAVDHWYDFSYDPVSSLGAEINLNVVTLHFQDGGLGDDDMRVNGEITDDGGPATATVSTANQTSSDGGGGDTGGGSSSGCFINTMRP
jgi:hypothetical protein